MLIREMTRLYLDKRMFYGIGAIKQSNDLQCFCNSRWFYRRPNGIWHCEICDRPYDAARDPRRPQLGNIIKGRIVGGNSR